MTWQLRSLFFIYKETEESVTHSAFTARMIVFVFFNSEKKYANEHINKNNSEIYLFMYICIHFISGKMTCRKKKLLFVVKSELLIRSCYPPKNT